MYALYETDDLNVTNKLRLNTILSPPKIIEIEDTNGNVVCKEKFCPFQYKYLILFVMSEEFYSTELIIKKLTI